MRSLLKKIEKMNLSVTELNNRMNLHFEKSHNLRMTILPILNKSLCDISEYYKGMFQAGEDSPETRWHFEMYMTLEQFQEGLKDEADGRKMEQKDFYENLLAYSKDIYNMEKSKYTYRAYKKVLTSKLDMMDYNYSREEKDWL